MGTSYHEQDYGLCATSESSADGVHTMETQLSNLHLLVPHDYTHTHYRRHLELHSFLQSTVFRKYHFPPHGDTLPCQQPLGLVMQIQPSKVLH